MSIKDNNILTDSDLSNSLCDNLATHHTGHLPTQLPTVALNIHPIINDQSSIYATFHSSATASRNRHYGFDTFATMNTVYAPPFVDPLSDVRLSQYGVVRIKNIPYGVTTQEVGFFINKLSHGLVRAHFDGYPVHIIIERPTGKTLEVYVEFKRPEDATDCVQRAQHSSRPLKIGQRHVTLEQSSQGELMAVLFPRAKCILWDPATGAPQVHESNDAHSEGFCGFFTVEEMASVVKHAESPHKSPFSARCMQRAYESTISTLYKFPWYATKHFTVNARDYLFTSYMAQLHVLVSKVAPDITQPNIHFNIHTGLNDREVGLSHSLLMDFLFAGLNVPAFSPRQKWDIVRSCGEVGAGFKLPPYAYAWPFQCLTAHRSAQLQQTEFWLNQLSSGFDLMIEHNMAHNFEQYLRTTRDYNGFIIFEFTPLGGRLPFGDAIAMETALMVDMVERGRMKWCQDHDIPYEALDLGNHPEPSTDLQLSNSIGAMSLHQTPSHRRSTDGQIPVPGPELDEPTQALVMHTGYPSGKAALQNMKPFRYQFDLVDRQSQFLTRNQAFGQLTTVTPSTREDIPELQENNLEQPQVPKSNIDPTCPEFVPARPWDLHHTPRISTAYNPRTSSAQPDDTITSFTDPFTGQSLTADTSSSLTGGSFLKEHEDSVHYGSNSNDEFDTSSSGAFDSSVKSHSAIGSNATVSPIRNTKIVSPHRGAQRGRRQTINIDSTIDECDETGRIEGGVHLKSASHDARMMNTSHRV